MYRSGIDLLIGESLQMKQKGISVDIATGEVKEIEEDVVAPQVIVETDRVEIRGQDISDLKALLAYAKSKGMIT